VLLLLLAQSPVLWPKPGTLGKGFSVLQAPPMTFFSSKISTCVQCRAMVCQLQFVGKAVLLMQTCSMQNIVAATAPQFLQNDAIFELYACTVINDHAESFLLQPLNSLQCPACADCC
jgi:hypothetical protein